MFLLKLVSRLPFTILYSLSDLLRFILFHILKYRKKTVLNNLKTAFPAYSDSELYKIAKDFYKNLCDIIVETLKSYSISPSSLMKRIRITNVDLINQYYDKQVPVIVMTSHLCNWEWLLLSNCILLKYEVDAVYKKLKNNDFDHFMKEIRGRFGANMIEKNNLIRSIAKRRNIIRILAMVSDQSPSSSSANLYFNFFGKSVPFYPGAEKIAQMTGYPVLFVSMTRVKRGYYEITFYHVADPPYSENLQITEKYIDLVENEIRKNPQNWLWSHKRWKHSRP